MKRVPELPELTRQRFKSQSEIKGAMKVVINLLLLTEALCVFP